MPKKVFYFDCETTGLYPRENAIIQLAYIVEINGDVKEEGNLLIQPDEKATIDTGALQVNKRTREEIFKAPFLPPREAYNQLMNVLDKYIDRYDKKDKFYPAGYNVTFDCNFLSEFMQRQGNPYFGAYFNGRTLDPRVLIAFMDYTGIIRGDLLLNHKLTSVCEFFEIKNEAAHDALSDIRATRQLMQKTWNHLVRAPMAAGGMMKSGGDR